MERRKHITVSNKRLLELLRGFLAEVELAYDNELPDLLRDFADKAAGGSGIFAELPPMPGEPGRLRLS
jgi:hypothetical protein